jgi:hypothetical protein
LLPALFLLFAATLLAQPQPQSDFVQAYVGQAFLVREHGGLHEVEKIKKEDAERYKGVCDKAVEVRAAEFVKGTLQFGVDE